VCDKAVADYRAAVAIVQDMKEAHAGLKRQGAE
jgi:hypothetical protein